MNQEKRYNKFNLILKMVRQELLFQSPAGKMLTKRLADLGLTPGTEIMVIGRTCYSRVRYRSKFVDQN